jgi:hypothetical protein
MTPPTLGRRHRVALAVLAAVAVVAVPVAVLAARGDEPASETGPSRPEKHPQATMSPDASPAGSEGWRTEIPADVRIDRALPDSENGLVHDRISRRVCDVELFPTDAVIDARAVTASGHKYAEARELRLFHDDRAAHRFVAHVRGAVTACPTQEVDGTLWQHRLRPSAIGGEEGVTAVQSFEVGGTVPLGANWWEVARVGNAVLITGTGSELAPGRPLDRAVHAHAVALRPVVEAMCVFAAPGCSADIPDTFPLLDGWPADDFAEPSPGYGRHGPGRDLAPLRLVACGRRLVDAPHTDRLLARWTNVEDFRTRQLTTFATNREAVAHVRAVADLYRSCPTEDEQAGYVQVTELRPTDEGDQSVAVVRRQVFDDAPAVGLEVIRLVRVGRAVLVDVVSNEGGAGPDPEAEVLRAIEGQARASTKVVEAMCAFTEGGC